MLRAVGTRRRGNLTKNWAEYSVTFQQAKAGHADLDVLVSITGDIDDASLQKASQDIEQVWKEQDKTRLVYGFLPEHSRAQSPQPGATWKTSETVQSGPSRIARKDRLLRQTL